MTKHEELRHKHLQVRRYMRRHHLQAVLLSQRSHFAWFTAGGDSHVLTTSEEGVATLFITPGKVAIVTNNIEAPRLMSEEAAPRHFHYEFTPWHDAAGASRRLRKLIGRRRVASDSGIAGTARLPEDFAELHYSLTPSEVQRYRWVGKQASEALEAAARATRPGMTEFQIASLLCKEVVARGMEATVSLIAVDDRVRKYRHPIPTGRRLKRLAMLVLGARRWGLIVSCTRLVHFGPVPAALARKHRAVCQVDAALNLSSRPGACIGDIFEAGVQAYRETGFAEEWHLHHQGGPTGYGARDYKGTPGERRCVLTNQALAWNPSIAGTKSEDTILARPRKVEFLSGPIDWPTIQVEYNGVAASRPDILAL